MLFAYKEDVKLLLSKSMNKIAFFIIMREYSIYEFADYIFRASEFKIKENLAKFD